MNSWTSMADFAASISLTDYLVISVNLILIFAARPPATRGPQPRLLDG